MSEFEQEQRKVESQLATNEELKALFSGGTTCQGDVVEVKFPEAKQVWSSAIKKQDLRKQHKVAPGNQPREMKSGYHRLTLHPTQLHFLYLGCESILVPILGLEIPPCPFCTRGFESAWDCRLSSCRHPYHTWYVYTHFSSNPMCMFDGCNSSCIEING